MLPANKERARLTGILSGEGGNRKIRDPTFNTNNGGRDNRETGRESGEVLREWIFSDVNVRPIRISEEFICRLSINQRLFFFATLKILTTNSLKFINYKN